MGQFCGMAAAWSGTTVCPFPPTPPCPQHGGFAQPHVPKGHRFCYGGGGSQAASFIPLLPSSSRIWGVCRGGG